MLHVCMRPQPAAASLTPALNLSQAAAGDISIFSCQSEGTSSPALLRKELTQQHPVSEVSFIDHLQKYSSTRFMGLQQVLQKFSAFLPSIARRSRGETCPSTL